MKYIIIILFILVSSSANSKSKHASEDCLGKLKYPHSDDEFKACMKLNESDDKVKCLDLLQLTVTGIEGKKSKIRTNVGAVNPKEFIFKGNHVAWVEGDEIRISSPKGSVVVDGRACNSSADLNLGQAVKLAYDYVDQYDEAAWKDVKEVCNAAGIGSAAGGASAKGSAAPIKR